MKIYALFFFAFTLVFLSSCSHKVLRIGYTKTNSEQLACQVSISKSNVVPESAKVMGSIKLGDTGFSVSCSEQKAIQILKKEACSLGANVVLIKSELLPGFLSSCYRCEADFLLIKGIDSSVEQPKIENNESVNIPPKEYSPKDKQKQVLGSIIGGTLGFVLGYTLVTLALRG